MASSFRRLARLAAILVALAALAVPVARADDVAATDAGGRKLAIKGYDVVAYFVDGRPEPGDPRYEHLWRGVWWRFATAGHRDLFAASPQSYAPEFGGFCAAAMALGVAVAADPEVWTIVDGKLYLNIDKATREEWRRNLVSNIDQASGRWSEHKYVGP